MPRLAGKIIGKNGLGLMRLTTPGAEVPDTQAFAVLKAALAAGANCWNGADFYGTPSANSLHLLRRYFAAHPEDADRVVLCVKSGIADMRTFTMDGSPAGVRAFVARANAVLAGTKKIDVFGIARVDPNVPVEDTVKALAEQVAAGAIGGIQLSEVGAATIRRAAAVARIDMVEAEVSLWATEILSNGVAEACAKLGGIPIVAHTPLGAGMLTGQVKSLDDLPPNSYLRHFPRFQPENFAKNLELVAAVEKLAAARGCTPAQLALSWIRQQSRRSPGTVPSLIPIFGARSADRVAENTKEVDLADEDFEAIDRILDSFPVAGTRYPAGGMKLAEY